MEADCCDQTTMDFVRHINMFAQTLDRSFWFCYAYGSETHPGMSEWIFW